MRGRSPSVGLATSAFLIWPVGATSRTRNGEQRAGRREEFFVERALLSRPKADHFLAGLERKRPRAEQKRPILGRAPPREEFFVEPLERAASHEEQFPSPELLLASPEERAATKNPLPESPGAGQRWWQLSRGGLRARAGGR